MADIIATEGYASGIGGSGSPDTNKGCTKARAESFGCFVPANYSSNQLVCQKDVYKLYINYYSIYGGGGWLCSAGKLLILISDYNNYVKRVETSLDNSPGAYPWTVRGIDTTNGDYYGFFGHNGRVSVDPHTFQWRVYTTNPNINVQTKIV